MRHLFPITSALLGLCLISAAPRAAGADTALGTSAWSLEIGTNVGSGANDGSFAIRHHSGASTAFRFAVEVNLNESDGDGTITTTGSPDIDADLYSSSSGTDFSVQWMHFTPIRDNVTATFAVGPVVEVQRQVFRIGFGLGTASFSGGEGRLTSTTYGVDLGLGMEWFFNRRLSLGGQTGLRATTGSGKQVIINRSATSITEQTIDTDDTRIDIGTARLNFTAYF